MVDRHTADEAGPARARVDAPETGNVAPHAGGEPDAFTRRVGASPAAADHPWEGFGHTLAAIILPKLKGQEGDASAAMTRAYADIRRGDPSGDGGRPAIPDRAIAEPSVPGRRAVLDPSGEPGRMPGPDSPVPDSMSDAPASAPAGPGTALPTQELGAAGPPAGPGVIAWPVPEFPAGQELAPARDQLDRGAVQNDRPPQSGGAAPVDAEGVTVPVNPAGGPDGGAPLVGLLAGSGTTAPAGQGVDLPESPGAGAGDGPSVPGVPMPWALAPVIPAPEMGVGGSAAFGDDNELRPDSPGSGVGGSNPPDATGISVPGGNLEVGAAGPFSVDVGPGRWVGGDVPEVRADPGAPGVGRPSLPIGMGGGPGDLPRAHGEPAVDLSRTNHLLEQLLEEIKKGHRGFLPPGAREVSPGR